MQPPLMRDPRLKLVRWRDLVPIKPWEAAWELFLPMPWLAGSLLSAHSGHIAIALACSFVFFLTALRLAHGATHYTIGLSREWTDRVMFAVSIAMQASIHAVQYNHMIHHQHTMDDDDEEARSARMPWWQAIVFGPLFTWAIHSKALRLGKARTRRFVMAEMIAIGVWIAVGVLAVRWPVLIYHTIAMTLGNCLTAFFAVWLVHHDCDREGVFARTVRSPLLGRVAFGLLYHIEHHLFPLVPTARLGELAQRVDEVMPEIASRSDNGPTAKRELV